jgi:hypothetical protein
MWMDRFHADQQLRACCADDHLSDIAWLFDSHLPENHSQYQFIPLLDHVDIGYSTLSVIFSVHCRIGSMFRSQNVDHFPPRI